MRGFSIERRLEIDMAHRVPTHGSKCWNIHGHRYVILAEAGSTELAAEGAGMDMVLDFSFLKEIMVDKIDQYHDHGITLWNNDPWLPNFFMGDPTPIHLMSSYYFENSNREKEQTKLMVVNFIPTAERLAEFWFKRMVQDVATQTLGKARLLKVTVFETPNCSAVYPREFT